MEACYFHDDEFYNILETMSPMFASGDACATGFIGQVEFCQKCKSAPCSCMKGGNKNYLTASKKLSSSGSVDGKSSCGIKESEDYSISGASCELPTGISKKTRTVGIVEPRVVVKIPSQQPMPMMKMGGGSVKTLPPENWCNVQVSAEASNERWPSPLGEQPKLLVTSPLPGGCEDAVSMKTNGSLSGHSQVDRQTIETALDDEVSPFRGGNEGQMIKNNKRKAAHAGNENSPDLLDILDNFLITTSSAGSTTGGGCTAFPPSSDESITNVSNVASFRQQQQPLSASSSIDGSKAEIKFTFEEEEEDDKQWMFCHVPGCSFWTSKSSRMERHKLCHCEPSELEVKRCYKCPDCHLKFYSLAKLLKHDRRKHTGIKDYECRICGAEVTDIQTHMRIHADQKNHGCEHCPLSFRHKSSLVRHMFLHTGERPYRCQSCQSSFTARDRLKGHILKHHPDHPAAQELLSQSQSQISQQQQASPCSGSGPPTPKRAKKTESTTADLSNGRPIISQQQQETVNETAASTVTTNFILEWPPTLQLGEVEGNLCWQAFDAAPVITPMNNTEVTATVIPQPQVVDLEEQPDKPNPLDVAIQEILQVNQITRFADKLRLMRNKAANLSKPAKKESVLACDKCGREYKYKSFLQVHQKRKCW